MTDRRRLKSSTHLKILQIATHTSLERGGAIQMMRLASGLSQRGHHVTALFNNTHLNSCGIIDSFKDSGVNLIGFNLEANDIDTSLQKLWHDIGGFDVVHAHRELALIVAARAFKHVSLPCLIAQRGTVYPPPLLGDEHRLLWGKRVHGIIAVAHAVKRMLVLNRLILPWKIEVIYGGIDKNRFHPAIDGTDERIKRGISESEKVIMLPGALIKKKGTEYFIRAASLCARRYSSLRFWIVGGGTEADKMKALADSLRFGEQMTFLGKVSNEQMPRLYAASDLVVCASIKGEGLTGTLREAMAMQRPVVSTNVCGNAEIVEEGVTGRLARARNAASLAHAISRSLDFPDQTNKMAIAGYHRIMEWCDESVRSAKVEQFYHNILKIQPIS